MILTSRLSSDGAGCDVGDLYQFPDKTGLLEEHSRWREAAALDTEVRPGVTSGSELSAVQIWRNPYWDGVDNFPNISFIAVAFSW